MAQESAMQWMVNWPSFSSEGSQGRKSRQLTEVDVIPFLKTEKILQNERQKSIYRKIMKDTAILNITMVLVMSCHVMTPLVFISPSRCSD